MTKKLFIKFSMLLFVLAMSTTSAWGYFGGRYYAKLTAEASSKTTGSGKVYVSSINAEAVNHWGSKRYLDSYPSDEQWAEWVDGESNVEYVGSIAAADGIELIASQFYAYAKADDGSYFIGWSFSDGAMDEGTDATIGLKLFPSKTRATLDPDDVYETDPESGEEVITSYGTVTNYNAKEHVLFASFEKLLIESYAISGETTTANDGEGNWKCEQTVTFRIAGKEVDVNDFDAPTLTKKTGTTGTWTLGEVTTNDFGDYGEVEVPVTFKADNANPGEFSATLLLRSKAGKTMNVVLSARTTGGAGEAIRYNSSKVQYDGEDGSGTLSSLLGKAVAGDIIKLNGNYSSAVNLNKNITFDLNGFTLNSTLTVSGGNVTIAYSPYGGSATSLSVTGGKAILNGGTFGSMTIGESGTVEQNGATITGAATNNGSLTTTDGKFQGGLTSSKTLVVNGGTFTGATAINVTAGTAQIKKGTISGTTYGVQSAGTTTIEKLAVISGNTMALNRTGGTLTVNNGKFTDPNKLASGDITFNAAYFQTNSSESATVHGKQVWRNTAGAEAREGYAFFAGDQEAALASNVSICRIGQAAYASLEEALTYANNHTAEQVTIFMENDYTLKAGYYTVPANATLIVPMSNEQQTANPVVPRVTSGSIATPVSFRKLILENGVNLEVAGTIELTCQQYGKQPKMGVPGGKYGHLIMKPGSHMTINNGGELRAWGFVTGNGTKDGSGNYLSGEIDARRGGTVREMFQMGDWKGGDISFTMIVDQIPQNMTHLFPVYTYFIQNVESPVKYHPGSSLICATSVNVADGISAYANDIKVVGKEGEPAMFLMDEMADAENTWVRKYYDAKKDQQVYEVNSGAQLGSIVIDLGELPASLCSVAFGVNAPMKLELDSRKFVLPLTNNFKIHLLSGSMQFTQSTSCLPGMEVEVDKESEISIIKLGQQNVVEGALYFYDADQWSLANMGFGGYVGVEHAYGAIVNYSATWDLDPAKPRKPNVRDISSPAAIGDAKLIVHGTFRSAEGCSVYTSWSKGTGNTLEDNPFTLNTTTGTGGASVISTNEDAGTFIFDDASPGFDGFNWDDPLNMGQINHLLSIGNSVLLNFDNNNYGNDQYPIVIHTVRNEDTRMYGWELCTPAMLKNGDGTFVATEGSPAGRSYCYMNDKWTSMVVALENECFMKDQDDIFYAKPAEYVAVVATVDGGDVVGNADHTFSDLAGAGRLFILMDDCQWWEVEKKDNLYHCIHPNNDTYYYWDATEGKWMEQRFTITWKNYDGTEIKSYTYDPVTGEPEEVLYSVTYGTQAEFLGSNPTHPADIDYTYTFTGWSPALGKVTSDVTYTATYEKQERKYTIIFQNEGGDEIERQFLTHNAMPKCENTPTCTGFTLQWEPEVAAVVGDATYRATWLENPPTEYQVTFFDYNGTTVLKQGNVAVGTVPTPPANPSGKPATPEFTYVFDHWSPALEAVSVEGPKSYTAVYREVAKTYEIKFYNETASSVLKTENLTYGAMPTPPAVTKENPEAGHTYTLVWKNLDESANIENVTANASYKPTYLDVVNRYTVTLRCNIPGACTFAGAGTYDYNTSVTIAANPASGYEFVKWQERAGEANLGEQNITADISLTAIVKVKDTPLPGNLNLGIDTTENDPAESYSDITITSNGISQSSQILNAGNITTLYGNADFRLVKSFAGSTWYCVAVPWRVDVNGGILLNGTTPAVLGKNIDICYYDGSVRAAQGKVDACWVYMRNLSTKKVLEPGRAYMIALKDGASSITFRKKVQEPLLTTNTSVTQYPSSTATDAGWNAIANPSLFHAYVNAGTTDKRGQRYLSEWDTYDWFRLDEHQLVVGEPVYVQVPSDKSIVVAKGASYAPRRVQAAQPTSFDVNITAAGAAKYADHLSVSLNEDKEENMYVIGQDLVKFGVSSKVAQMWIDRYDSKLCVNTVAPEGDATNFPMSIFAPKAGDYTIAIEREVNTDDVALYLTYNGEAIWNLSEGAYVAHLNKGTDNNYGLRISARAPQITTGIDEAVVDAQGETRKVLINDQVFIIRGEKVYSVDGQLVK